MSGWPRRGGWRERQGDVASPNTANAGIAKVLAVRARGSNANEAYWLEFECVGYGSTYPITKAQKQFCTTRIAATAKATGLPVNRVTVHGHSDINSVNRASCPCAKTSRESFLGDVIAKANAILQPPITTVTVEIDDRCPNQSRTWRDRSRSHHHGWMK